MTAEHACQSHVFKSVSCCDYSLRSDCTRLCMQLEIGPSATNEDRASLYFVWD